ncbi:MAG: 3,4-dihydroxy-2-butanone-4-phosphate synthase [Streptosporangiales bacterium]|nr:3,4-dihydroxy-2-butanone-4-phosphate synthase [Streptosporangiales bacterium]
MEALIRPRVSPAVEGHAEEALSTVEEAVAAIAAGGFVIVVDDEGRENEGDLIVAAEQVTADQMGFMVRYTSGVICVALEPGRLRELRLPLMVPSNEDLFCTAFTVTADYAPAATTGISAAERAATARALADPATHPTDLVRPGHVFPLRYREGGVLRRPGHTEAAVDLARLAGLRPAGVLAEIVNDDGTMARRDDLRRFARRHGIPLISVAALIRYRLSRESVVQRVGECWMPLGDGAFTAYCYQSQWEDAAHVALVHGSPVTAQPTLVRVHHECLLSDMLAGGRCACGSRLRAALSKITDRGSGVLIYLRRGAPNGLLGCQAAEPSDPRWTAAASHILTDLGVSRVRVLAATREPWRELETYGVTVVGRAPLHPQPTRLHCGGRARALRLEGIEI